MKHKAAALRTCLRLAVAVLLLLGVFYWASQQQATPWQLSIIPGRLWAACAAMGLLSLNLGLEVAKQRLLLRAAGYTPSWRAVLRAVLAGGCLGFITPNRWGEYLGRCWMLPQLPPWQVAASTALSRISQLPPTLLVAGLLTALVPLGLPGTWLAGVSPQAGLWAGGVLVLLGLWLMPRARGLLSLLPRSFRSYGRAVIHVPQAALAHTLLFATLRLGVFVAQYALWVYAAGSDAPGTLLLAGAALTLALKTGLPSVAIAELGIREGVALVTFSALGVEAGPVLAGTMGMFIINLALPALAGWGVLMGGPWPSWMRLRQRRIALKTQAA